MQSTAPAKSFADVTERLSLYAPKGTKALLEDYRRKNGFRSLNETITYIIRSEVAQ